LTEPLAVGVEPLTAGQLIADGDDFRAHRCPKGRPKNNFPI
jgi:hypothetical protein